MAHPRIEETDVGDLVAFPGAVPPPRPRQPPVDGVEASDESPRVEPYIYDAEIVDEEQAPNRGLRDRLSVLRPRDTSPARVIRGDREPLGRVAGRAVARSALQVAIGHAVWASRAVDAATHGAIRERIRQARAAGDLEAQAVWMDRLEHAKTGRRRRIRELPVTIKNALLAVLVAVVVLAGLVLVGGIAVAMNHPWGMTWSDYWSGWDSAGHTLVMAVTVVMQVVAFGWLPAWLFAAHRAGRARRIPAWAIAPAQRHADGEVVTPSRVVTALRDLGVAALRRAVQEMGDAGAAMLSPIRIAGCGVEVDVYLPSGVSTDEVQRRRRKLAENLDRHEHELFITIPPQPRTVRLWIADSGALDEPIGPSPLVIDPDVTADLYTGRAPWGQDLRGDAAAIALLQRHLLITGLSNQGKTASLRALVLWLALDPTTEFHIADLKGVGDWRMFDGLAETLIQGPTDEHVIAATEMLEWGVVEMQRRTVALEASGAKDGVTRTMARAPGSGFHPIFLIVDEAQQAFMCPAVGADKRPYGGTKHTSRYFAAARRIHNQGRAVNVVLWQGTQDPTDQNLPKLVREGAHIRASLVVGTEEQARMALGDKAVNGGAAPHKLRQGADKGTLVVAGDGVPLPAGQASLTIRTHFIDGEAAEPLADRAKAMRGQRDVAGEEQDRDLLDDVAATLRGEAAVKASDVAARLRELAPGHHPYAALTAEQLAAALGAVDVPVRKKDGYLMVRTERVQAALDEREFVEAID